MTRYRSAARVLLGLLLVVQGLGHGVLPLRGAGAGPPGLTATLLTILPAIAIPGFVAAGFGLLELRPFRARVVFLTHLSALASLSALVLMGDPDLWPGAVIDLIAAASVSQVLRERTVDASGAGTKWPLARLVLESAAILFFGYVAMSAMLWPWHRIWGVQAEEQRMALPGDRTPRLRDFEVTHGVTIDAPPEDVWPWLAQIGQDRAGFYSYEWLERLFLVDIRNAEALRPEWTSRKVGDFVRATQPDYLGGALGSQLGWYVTEVQPNRALVLHYWGAFVLLPEGPHRTRFIVRSTMSDPEIPTWGAALAFTLFELPHFIMERRMLLGIKERAERSRGTT